MGRKAFRVAKSGWVQYPLPTEIVRSNTSFDVQVIEGDRVGRLWVSIVRHGIYRWANGVWTHFGDVPNLPRDTAVFLLADSAGRIWFGHMGSQIAVLDGGHVKTFTSRDGLEVVNIQAIYEHSGRVWLGSIVRELEGVFARKGDKAKRMIPRLMTGERFGVGQESWIVIINDAYAISSIGDNRR